jgi:hypothetical protein
MSFTFQEIENNYNTTATNAVTLTGSVAAGDFLLAIANFYVVGGQNSVAFTDTVNSGGYTIPSALNYTANSPQITAGWIKCNASGTPTITATGNAGLNGWNLYVLHYTCTNNNPSLVTADCTTNNGNSGTFTSTNFSNTATNELTVAINLIATGTPGSVTGGWTNRGSSTNPFIGDLITSTTGNTISYGASAGSTTWTVMLASWQDAASSTNTAPIAWIT